MSEPQLPDLSDKGDYSKLVIRADGTVKGSVSEICEQVASRNAFVCMWDGNHESPRVAESFITMLRAMRKLKGPKARLAISLERDSDMQPLVDAYLKAEKDDPSQIVKYYNEHL